MRLRDFNELRKLTSRTQLAAHVAENTNRQGCKSRCSRHGQGTSSGQALCHVPGQHAGDAILTTSALHLFGKLRRRNRPFAKPPYRSHLSGRHLYRSHLFGKHPSGRLRCRIRLFGKLPCRRRPSDRLPYLRLPFGRLRCHNRPSGRHPSDMRRRPSGRRRTFERHRCPFVEQKAQTRWLAGR